MPKEAHQKHSSKTGGSPLHRFEQAAARLFFGTENTAGFSVKKNCHARNQKVTELTEHVNASVQAKIVPKTKISNSSSREKSEGPPGERKLTSATDTTRSNMPFRKKTDA